MDALRTLQDQEHRTRRLLAALDEHQHLVGVYQGSEEALAEHCRVLQQQVAEVHADRAEIHASLLVRCPLPSRSTAAAAWVRALACGECRRLLSLPDTASATSAASGTEPPWL